MTITIQQAMSELLLALGFEAMARDVLAETDKNRLSKYARIIIKQSPQDKKIQLHTKFATLNLV